MAIKDKTKLVKKRITDKTGKSTTVWVKPSVGTSDKKPPKEEENEKKQREDKERGSSTPLLEKLDKHKETQAEMRKKYGDLSYDEMKKQVAKEEGLDSYNDFDKIEQRVFQINEWTSGERVNNLREEIQQTYQKKDDGEKKSKEDEKKFEFIKWGDAGFTRDGMKSKQGEAIKALQPHNDTFEETKSEISDMAKGAEIKGRVKEADSASYKVHMRDPEGKYKKDVTNLKDATGFMVIRDNVKDVNKDTEALKKKYKVLEEKDYNKNPKGDYRATHLILQDKNGKTFEVQMKTKNQGAWAEWSHDIYKPMTIHQSDALKKSGTTIRDYGARMSDYFAKVDNGIRGAIMPPCVEVVAITFGCLP